MPIGNGVWTDFVTDFMSYTEHSRSSELHRKWAAISAISGALERRVWTRTGDMVTFPNLYVLLVAPPGIGKFVIESIRDLWSNTVEPGTQTHAFHVAADSVTKASIIDDLSAAKQSHILPSGPPFIYHSLLIPSEEFEVLLPDYDPSFISRFNSLFNNKNLHRETRRHGPARDVVIINPQLHILAGATPAYFTAHFPDEAWATGLIRRIIMVYSAETPLRDIFLRTPDKEAARQRLLHRLSLASILYGEASWGALQPTGRTR